MAIMQYITTALALLLLSEVLLFLQIVRLILTAELHHWVLRLKVCFKDRAE